MAGVSTHLPNLQPYQTASSNSPSGEFDDGRTLSPTSFVKHMDISNASDEDDTTIRLPSNTRLSKVRSDENIDRNYSASPPSLKKKPVYSARRSAANQSPSTNESRVGRPASSLLLNMVPEEIINAALNFIEIQDVAKVSAVCKMFGNMCNTDGMWREFCVREHGPDLQMLCDAFAPTLEPGTPFYWKQMYKALMSYEIDLSFFTGPREGEKERVKMHGSEEIMMGRSRKNNICILQDEMVSRTHAKLSVKGGKYYIQDLGSINGTAINATIMESHRDVRLRLSDEVEMGNSTFRVHVRDPLEVEEDTQVEGDSDVEDDNDGHHLEAAEAALDGIEPFDEEDVAGIASDDEGADEEVGDSDNGEE